MNGSFTANDIVAYLALSENKDIQSITLAYVSGQLCKLAEKNKINIIERNRGKGGGNIYSKNKQE